MTDANATARRYVAMWNEPDAERRRSEIAALFAGDNEHFITSQEVRGADAMERRVTTSYEKWVRDARYLFHLAGEPQSHHGGVLLRWRMAPASGGGDVSLGSAFLVLADDGRIRRDWQFTDPS